MPDIGRRGRFDAYGPRIGSPRTRRLWNRGLLVFAGLLMVATRAAHGDIWFARAGGAGEGRGPAAPIGSTAVLERMTKPGDVIVLLPAESPLDGGLALKQGQTLMGHTERGRKPAITNTDPGRHGGSGLVLADDCRVVDVRVTATTASGVYGVDVTGACLIGVDIDGSNRSRGLTEFEVGLIGKICHGGILLVSSNAGQEARNHLIRCVVTDAAGIGIGTIALRGARSSLVVDGSIADGGAAIPPLFDMGVAVIAEGEGSASALEMSGATVARRMGEQGRNLIAFASAGGKATARIERSTSGESGQDGVIAVASMVPATAEIAIRDSIIEKAAQINLEGTILNLPPSDPARAHEGSVSIDVVRCVIRNAGFVDGFRGEAQNIWLAPSVLADGPFPLGRYRLTVRDSVIEGARKGGITMGNSGSDFKIGPDEGEYDVILSGNTIRENGGAELEIAAAKAKVDARGNFWGAAGGPAAGKVRLRDGARPSQLDTSEPLERARDEPRK